MALPTCTTKKLVSDALQYTAANLADREQLAVLVWQWASAVSQAGGTDYRSKLVGQLLTDAALISPGLSEDQFVAGQIELLSQWLGTPTSLNDAKSKIPCLLGVSEELLRSAILMLMCQWIAKQ